MSQARLTYYLSDNLVEILGLKNVATAAWISSGTVQVDGITDRTGATVGSVTFPIAMAHVPGSQTTSDGESVQGNWRGNIPDTAAFELNEEYKAQISADAGTNLKRTWFIPLKILEGTD